jgi:L-ascorbate metabolism protein UlaG (beta-lactamase superfamily)
MEQSDNYVMLTANAGVLVCYQGKKILIDALHDRYTNRFSSVPDALLEEIAEGKGVFSDIDLMVYTHDHPDHYSERWTRRFLQYHPQTILLSPIGDFAGRENVRTLMQNEEHFWFDGIKVDCRRLLHDGHEYAGIPNYGYIFGIDGYHTLTLGDATFDRKQIGEFVNGRTIDLALMNFPFVTLSRGREIVTGTIHPKKVIADHLPYEEKDSEGYIRSTKGAVRRNTVLPPVAILYQMKQTEPIG